MTQPLPTRHRTLLFIGSIGPLGHMPASGTFTVALIGIPLFWATWRVPPPMYLAMVVAVTVVSIAIHHAGDRVLGTKDSRLLVWDELVGFLIAVAMVPFTWQTALCAFLIERALDIAKFPPANWVERRWPGGWGVVGDDVVAGLYTCGIMHLLVRFAPGWMGLGG